MGTIGTQEQVRRRRKRGMKLRKAGRTQKKVASELGVSTRTVRRWEYKERNPSQEPVSQRGRPAKLSEAQLRQLEQELDKGSSAHGYLDEGWTLDRIRQLVWHLFGVRYDASGMWHVMNRLGWSWQKPQRRAVQRVEEEIDAWKRYTWRRIKKVS